MNFSLENLRLLVKVERDMDEGLVPFVVADDGARLVVRPEVMDLFQLKSGQRVSAVVISAILEKHLAIYKREIKLAEAPPS